MAPRAYFVPFETAEKAAEDREGSAYFTALNGEWDFAFFPNVEELAIEDENFTQTVKCPDKMPVPFCWELMLGKGYDVPNYINQDYPYPVDPPYLPDVIPCGFYRRTKTVKKLSGKKYYINFEGVASCFYLWVNGVFKGYSQVSHCTSEFDITDLLTDGENRFEVLVVKHCTGSYLEDQDFFRLSGIFRDVYILERDENHISDIFVKPYVSDDLRSAEIKVTPEFDGEIAWTLASPAGETVSGGVNSGEFRISVDAPVLWNAEAPMLYTLTVHAGNEYIAFPVGIRRVEIKDSVFLLNGEKVKIRGVNRHDMTPETGYAVSVEEMLEDLYSLKRANVNAIRTSHYPNDPRFPGLCDRLGFMLIDETDLESHGMGYNYGDWYWDYWAYLCDSPDWTDACLDRMERLFERDKNRASVILWSLGNESGCGENHRKMADYVRSRDDTAIIHYENARIDYQERLHKDFSDISDVESRMYASLEYLESYLEDDSLTKPFFYCEYVSAWSTGDIPLHWGEFEKHDKYMGGCIWEYKDHAVNIGTKEAPKYRYGGDFGDKPNDGIYCVDGLVHPDRRPRPGYAEMKQTYKPFEAAYENGVITIRNKRIFASLAELSAYYTAEVDGEVVLKKEIGALCIAPGETVSVPAQLPAADGNVTLNVHVYLNEDAPYAEKGYEVGFEQFIIKRTPVSLPAADKNTVAAEESRTEIKIICGDIKYTFSRITGMLTSVYHGKELLAAPAELSIYRAYLPNCSDRSAWERARYNEAKTKCYSCVLKENTAEKAVVTASLSMAAAAMPPAFRTEMTYTVDATGALHIDTHTTVIRRAPVLPRFGIKLVMPAGYEHTEYLGLGERETYADRHACERFSLYKTTADADFEHYVRPTECSSHYGTLFAKVTNDEGGGLAFVSPDEKGFCFASKHYSDVQLMETKHDDELVRDDKLHVNLDYRIHAENAGNAGLCPERSFDEKAFGFSLSLFPLRAR